MCAVPVTFKSRRLEDALADFSAAIDTDPSSALSFNSRALLLERLGQPAAALADHDAAVALDARDAGYIKSRGLCARALGQYEAAARDFTRWVGRKKSSKGSALQCKGGWWKKKRWATGAKQKWVGREAGCGAAECTHAGRHPRVRLCAGPIQGVHPPPPSALVLPALPVLACGPARRRHPTKQAGALARVCNTLPPKPPLIPTRPTPTLASPGVPACLHAPCCCV